MWTRIRATCASARKASWASTAGRVRAGRAGTSCGGRMPEGRGVCMQIPGTECVRVGAAHSSFQGKVSGGRARAGEGPILRHLVRGSSLCPWQEPPRTTVSVTTAVDAWEPTPPSASAPQASLGSSANLVGNRGWGGGGVSSWPCPRASPNQGLNGGPGLGPPGPGPPQWSRDPHPEMPEPGHPGEDTGFCAAQLLSRTRDPRDRLRRGFLLSLQKSRPRPAT